MSYRIYTNVACPFLSLPLSSPYSIGNGSWVIAGVTTIDVINSGNQTAIQCTSNHLTSFAVLVDVAGGLAVSIVTQLACYPIYSIA